MTQHSDYLGRILDNFLETHEKWYNIKQPPVDPFRLVAKLAEELGEVSEAVLAVSGSVKKTAKLKEKGVEPQEALKEELGDLLITICNLTKGYGIKIGSFEEILEAAEKKMRERSVGPAFGERPEKGLFKKLEDLDVNRIAKGLAKPKKPGKRKAGKKAGKDVRGKCDVIAGPCACGGWHGYFTKSVMT